MSSSMVIFSCMHAGIRAQGTPWDTSMDTGFEITVLHLQIGMMTYRFAGEWR